MLTSNVQLGYVLTRGGGQAVQGGLSWPPPRISERKDNQQILLHHLLQEYLVERDVNFISVNLRCLLQTFSWVTYWQGVGASCPGRFILPPAQISERMDNPQILLHHLLQEYLVERDINFISVNLRCLLQTFSWVTYWQRVGGKLSRAVYLVPAQNFRENWLYTSFITPSTTGIFSWKGCKLYFSQSEMLTSNVQLGYVLTRGGGQAVQGGLSWPPPRISERKDNQQILLHYLLQEYLVERGCKLYFSQSEMLTSNVQLGYILTRGGGQAVQGGLSCPPPRISKRMDNLQILLHHLLQEY